jgi:hypothetical protein
VYLAHYIKSNSTSKKQTGTPIYYTSHVDLNRNQSGDKYASCGDSTWTINLGVSRFFFSQDSVKNMICFLAKIWKLCHVHAVLKAPQYEKIVSIVNFSAQMRASGTMIQHGAEKTFYFQCGGRGVT